MRSPPRRRSRAGSPRRAVGTDPPVPTKKTDKSMWPSVPGEGLQSFRALPHPGPSRRPGLPGLFSLATFAAVQPCALPCRSALRASLPFSLARFPAVRASQPFSPARFPALQPCALPCSSALRASLLFSPARFPGPFGPRARLLNAGLRAPVQLGVLIGRPRPETDSKAPPTTPIPPTRSPYPATSARNRLQACPENRVAAGHGGIGGLLEGDQLERNLALLDSSHAHRAGRRPPAL